ARSSFVRKPTSVPLSSLTSWRTFASGPGIRSFHSGTPWQPFATGTTTTRTRSRRAPSPASRSVRQITRKRVERVGEVGRHYRPPHNGDGATVRRSHGRAEQHPQRPGTVGEGDYPSGQASGAHRCHGEDRRDQRPLRTGEEAGRVRGRRDFPPARSL